MNENNEKQIGSGSPLELSESGGKIKITRTTKKIMVFNTGVADHPPDTKVSEVDTTEKNDGIHFTPDGKMHVIADDEIEVTLAELIELSEKAKKIYGKSIEELRQLRNQQKILDATQPEVVFDFGGLTMVVKPKNGAPKTYWKLYQRYDIQNAIEITQEEQSEILQAEKERLASRTPEEVERDNRLNEESAKKLKKIQDQYKESEGVRIHFDRRKFSDNGHIYRDGNNFIQVTIPFVKPGVGECVGVKSTELGFYQNCSNDSQIHYILNELEKKKSSN
jgi:hypothetical protein